MVDGQEDTMTSMLCPVLGATSPKKTDSIVSLLWKVASSYLRREQVRTEAAFWARTLMIRFVGHAPCGKETVDVGIFSRRRLQRLHLLGKLEGGHFHRLSPTWSALCFIDTSDRYLAGSRAIESSDVQAVCSSQEIRDENGSAGAGRIHAIVADLRVEDNVQYPAEFICHYRRAME